MTDWTAVTALSGIPTEGPPPDSFTVREYAERFNLTHRGAQLRLDALVHRGALQGKMARVDGRPKRVYWIPEASDVPRRGNPRK